MSDVLSFAHVGSPVGEPLHYTSCGLDNIYLAGGYETKIVAGEKYVAIKDLEDLHRAIALYLVRHVKVLGGKEVRFLRKFLDLTQRELGDFLRVSDQSIARYEKGQTTLEGSADNVLRLLVTTQAAGCINVREELESLKEADDASSPVITLERQADEWRVAA